MKVKCLNTSKYNLYDRLPLTVDKVYDVIEVTKTTLSPKIAVDSFLFCFGDYIEIVWSNYSYKKNKMTI